MQKNLCGGFLFNEIAGKNSRPAILIKKASDNEVYLWLHKNFPRFNRNVLQELRLFNNIEDRGLQAGLQIY